MIAFSAAFSAGEPYKAMLPDEAKFGSIPLILKEGSRNMSSRFFYVQFKFTPKIRTSSVPTNKQHGAVVQVPKDLVQRMQECNENLSEKAIALDLARRAALGTFPTVQERVTKTFSRRSI
jgi:hypothetical protein